MWGDEAVSLRLTRVSAGLIVIVYIIVGVLFAGYTPDWQAPDEPAHYNTVRQVAENGCCPIIEAGDWQQAYQNEIVSARFAPELLGRLDSIQYEDHQPPLYYLLSSIIFRVFNGSLTALRVFSVLLGAAVLVCVYILVQRLFPDRPGVVLGTMLLFGFLPQHMAMLASVNNDALAELFIALTLLAAVRYLEDGQPREWVLGVLVGLIFLTKSTGYFMAAVVLVAIVWRWWINRTTFVGAQRAALLPITNVLAFLLPALLLGGLWWVRNIGVYGFPDFLGLRAHNSVVADQLRTADFIAEEGQQAYINRFVTDTFNSFWGQFGWMALPLQGWMYRAFQALLLIALGGIVVDRAVLRSPVRRRGVWVVFALVIAFATLAYLYYNSEFLQPQGRYLFPGLMPLVLVIVLAVDSWRRWLLARLWWLTPALFALLIPLDVYLLGWVIRPLLAAS